MFNSFSSLTKINDELMIKKLDENIKEQIRGYNEIANALESWAEAFINLV